jgi:LexA-binding, inner membrane-associated putative hydrolase
MGLVSGVGLAAAAAHAPLQVRLLAIAVTGGAALLNDLDTPSSKVSRSLGSVTQLLAVGIAGLSGAYYHGTRGERDSADTAGTHRFATHTILCAVLFGVIAGVATRVSWVSATILLSLLIGLLANGYRSLGIGFTVAGACLTGYVTHTDLSWWWLWGVSVSTGMLTHIAGDCLTNRGCPLFAPMDLGGYRWKFIRTPVTFSTGTSFETHVVTPMLFLTLGVSAGFASGLLPVLIGAL